MTGAPFLVLLSVLQQQPQASSTVEDVPSDSPEAQGGYSPSSSYGSGYTPSSGYAPSSSSSSSSWSNSSASSGGGGGGVSFLASLEVGPLYFPSGTPGGSQDGFLQAYPQIGVDGGDDFEFVLGAPPRFRLLDEEPLQKSLDHGAYLRREDWDERSDFGQVVRRLRIGSEEGRFVVRVGPFVDESLGYGHLVGHYTNVINPDYHPAGGSLAFTAGPAQVQVLASDVLAARLFAGEVRLDIGRLASTNDQNFDRYHVIASAAHDFGEAGGVTPAMTAVQLGGDAALYKGAKVQVFALASAGARVDVDSPDVGGAAGFAIRGQPRDSFDISGRLEGRYQGGSFRFGLFGAGYELSRFSATGLSEQPLSEERLARHFSGFGEVSLALGDGRDDGMEVVASASGEYFAFGRVDADLALRFQLPGGKAGGIARVVLTGLLDKPRYSVNLSATYRLLPALYTWAGGGTVHFPQADGNLVRGAFAGAGVGVDFER
ncbi:hypothetical protein P2318_31105 [Myxococcaceae bacterium GXIMD 01537]